MSSPVGAEDRECRVGCQCLFRKEDEGEGEGERHSARSLESHGEHHPWSADYIIRAGGDKPTTTKRSTSCVGVHVFGCLSHRWSIIGLPKIPDTEFKRRSHAGRFRPNGPKGNSGRPAISIISPEAALGGVSRTNSGPVACEPSSPDVSCIGRVKLKKKEARKWTSTITGGSCRRVDGGQSEPEDPRHASKLVRMKRFFAGSRTKFGQRPGLPSAPEPDAGAPGQQLKRLASVRQPATFADLVFGDCGQNEAAYEDSKICRQNESTLEDSKICRQNEEMKKLENGASMRMSNSSVVSSEEDEESEVSEESTIAHSCSILLKKNCINDEPLPVPTTEQRPPSEINLWKRRSVAPIKSLDLGNNRGNGFQKPSTV